MPKRHILGWQSLLPARVCLPQALSAWRDWDVGPEWSGEIVTSTVERKHRSLLLCSLPERDILLSHAVGQPEFRAPGWGLRRKQRHRLLLCEQLFSDRPGETACEKGRRQARPEKLLFGERGKPSCTRGSPPWASPESPVADRWAPSPPPPPTSASMSLGWSLSFRISNQAPGVLTQVLPSRQPDFLRATVLDQLSHLFSQVT